jgi:hypothetical protein
VLAAVLLAASSPASARTLTWSVVPSPSPGPIHNAEFDGVSCVSAVACTAVGLYFTRNDDTRTLAESWNGTRWSVVPSPSPISVLSQLNGVSCVSAVACTAVGYYFANGDYRTLVESWNGTRWSVVPSPSPGSIPNLLEVSCVSAVACTAVGNTGGDSLSSARTLVESWNGTRWSVVPSPSPGSIPFLVDVSCVSAVACTAVGSTGTYHVVTLIESWNGTRWSVAASPSPSRSDNYLYGVSCISATRCTATGEAGFKTLVESWNGTRWSVVPSPSPSPSPRSNALGGVSCVSATACTAVGSRDSDNFLDTKTLIESWNGTRWSVAASPSPRKPISQLGSVSCVSATECTAAGNYENAKNNLKTLIETGTASH